MKKIITSQLAFIVVLWAIGQPNTEVYLFDLIASNSGYQLANPINISNNPGYDNQPYFWPDSKSILYSRTVNAQTEIARYWIASGKTDVITNTLQGSEYSPTPTPDGAISSIRLDTTGLQLLYRYDLDGNDKVLVEELVIGYHAWINTNELVAFVLGEPITMQLINTKNSNSKLLADSIGRSLHKIPGSSSFSFVDKSGDMWAIRSMNPKNRKISILVATVEGSEDYCWTMNEEIIMGKEDQLWIWKRGKDWRLLADLSEFNLTGISRVSVSPSNDKLVVVVNE